MRFGSAVSRRVFGLGCLALLILLPAATAVAKTGRVFSGLVPGQTLELEYRESGFVTTTYALTFTRGETGPASVRVTGGASAARTLPLTGADLEGLDRTLAHFREVRGGRCTTELWISLARRSGDVLSPPEEHTDRTCNAPPGGLTFAALVARQP